MGVGLVGICCKVNRKCSLTRYRRDCYRLIFFSACPNTLSKFSWDMESCIWILYVHWKNTAPAQRIAFNCGFLLIFFFWQVYLCFLSIAFVKSRGKGHGQVCPGKDGPYSPELSWSCKGYTCFVQQSNTVLVTAAKPPPWKKNRGSPAIFPQPKTLLQTRKPLCSGALWTRRAPWLLLFQCVGFWFF